MKDYISLIRLPQWIKNTFIFLPAFFAGKFFDFALLSELLPGFAAFTAAWIVGKSVGTRNVPLSVPVATPVPR